MFFSDVHVELPGNQAPIQVVFASDQSSLSFGCEIAGETYIYSLAINNEEAPCVTKFTECFINDFGKIFDNPYILFAFVMQALRCHLTNYGYTGA